MLYVVYLLIITNQRPMNYNYHGLSQCNSQQHLTLPYYHPVSPFHKIATPHRARINTSTPSIQTSPITFLTAIHRDKSPNEKENQPMLLNHSPLINTFNSKHGELPNEKRKSPIAKINKKLGSRIAHHAYHKSETIEQNDQILQKDNAFCQNFEQSLRSLAQKQPQNYLQTKSLSKVKFSNNFKGILEAQQYQIKQKDFERKGKQNLLKKSSSITQFNPKMFSSCFEGLEKPANSFSSQRQGKQNLLLCMNDDGNTAKYITIASQQEDERLYYCSKCTLLLVNQGFVLQEIKSNEGEIERKSNKLILIDVSDKIEACKDKLSSLINDLSMREDFEIKKITQFYQSLSIILERCRQQNEQLLKAIYKQKIEDYESILEEIDHFGRSVQQTQQNFQQFQSLQAEVLKFTLGDPVLKKYDTQSIKKMQEEFVLNIQENFKLSVQGKFHTSKQSQLQQSKQGIMNRNHGLRFSFQKLLNDINCKKSKMKNMMNCLQEQQEQDSDCIQISVEKNQKNAFRDLFPEGEQSSQLNSGVNSPTFKNF